MGLPVAQMPLSTGVEGDPVDMSRIQSSVWGFQEERWIFMALPYLAWIC